MSAVYPQLQFGAGRLWKVKDKFYEYYQCNRYHEDIYREEAFEKASFYLQEREKVGVIGINGTGKSTLLKIAAGIEEPDEGQVIRANHIVVRYLPQNPVFDPELSVIDTVLAQSSQNFVGGTSEQNQNAGNHAEHVEH